MIAADTSTWIPFLEGERGQDAQMLDKALEERQVLMVPAALTELLSDPKLPAGPNPLHIARILLASVLRLMQRQILIVYESGSPSGIKCHALLSKLIVV